MKQNCVRTLMLPLVLTLNVCALAPSHGIIQEKVSETLALVRPLQKGGAVGKEVWVFSNKCTAGGLAALNPCENFAKDYGQIRENKLDGGFVVAFSPKTHFEVGDFIEY